MKENSQPAEISINNARNINTDRECSAIINQALDFLSIVTKTLGPGGRPIFLERKKLDPLSTKDGVTVAKTIYHSDRAINTIIQSIKEARRKTNEEAGDGTTTAIALTNAIFKEAMKFIESEASRPDDLANEITQAAKLVEKSLLKMVKSIKQSKKSLYDVAFISCNGDQKIAQMVVKAFDEVGEEGVIAVDEGLAQEATLRIEEGYELKRGLDNLGVYGIHYITDKISQESVLRNVNLLLYDGEISDVNQLAEALTTIGGVQEQGQVKAVRMPPLAIVAYDFKGPALNMLTANRVQAGLSILPIIVHSTGTKSQPYTMEDLAILSGGTVISPSQRQLGTVTVKDLGKCEKIVMTMKKTRMFNLKGDPNAVLERVGVLKKQIEDAETQWDKENVRERLGKLIGGIAVIGIGGGSDLERKERKDRVEDAINATRDALEEGVVAGGGVSLLLAGNLLRGKTNGEIVLKRALEWPIKHILQNAGVKTIDLIMSQLQAKEFEVYDARKRVFGKSAIDSGVLDPLKVVRSSFNNACSIAKELIKAGGIVSFIKQPELDDPYHNIDE